MIAETTRWHATSIDRALTDLQTDLAGLTDQEAAARLSRFGPNRLSPAPPVSALAILRDQLTGVVVLLLFAAALISLALDDRLEAAAIGAVLVINTLIGFLTEWRARRAMEALRELDVPGATVVRRGHPRIVDAQTLVPGDIIELSAGHKVPADARVIQESDLRTNEAALTGESLPVSKTAETVLDPTTALADRINLVFKGTTIAAGTGRAVVVATGTQTEVGRIGTLVGSVTEERTPLERRLDALGRRLVWLSLGVAALVAVLGAAQGARLALVVETGIALAVAAVPEALPAVATIALAVGMRRMARRHALVRRLPAVETLGSTTDHLHRQNTDVDVGRDGCRAALDGRSRRQIAQGGPARGSARRRCAQCGCARQSPAVGLGRVERADGRRPQTTPDRSSIRLTPPSCAPPTHRHFERHLVQLRPALGMVPFSSDRKFMASFHDVDGHVTAFVEGRTASHPGHVRPRRCVRTASSHSTTEDARRCWTSTMVSPNADSASWGSPPGPVRDSRRPRFDLTFVGFLGPCRPAGGRGTGNDCAAPHGGSRDGDAHRRSASHG